MAAAAADRRARARRIVAALERAYPRSRCALHHKDAWQLLVATVLSAQTSDAAVNAVTRRLFARYPDAQRLASATRADVEAIVRVIGLWRTKAANIIALSDVVARTGMPTDLDSMVRLPGVGRKTATAVLGTAFGVAAGVTVDTHMLRINRLLGLSQADDAGKMADDLETLLPKRSWPTYTHRIIDHGRLVCVARRPRCGICPLARLCDSAGRAPGYKEANDAQEPASARNLSWL